MRSVRGLGTGWSAGAPDAPSRSDDAGPRLLTPASASAEAGRGRPHGIPSFRSGALDRVRRRSGERADEHVQAALEPDDLDVAAAAAVPRRLAPDGSGWCAPTRPAGGPLASPFSSYPTAREVAREAALSSKAPLSASSAPRPAKARCSIGLAHLAPESLSLVGPAEPGTRLDRAHGAEVLAPQVLDHRSSSRRRRRPW